MLFIQYELFLCKHRKQWLMAWQCFRPWVVAKGEPAGNVWIWTWLNGWLKVPKMFAERIPTCLSNSSSKWNRKMWYLSRRCTWHSCVRRSDIRCIMCVSLQCTISRHISYSCHFLLLHLTLWVLEDMLVTCLFRGRLWQRSGGGE